MDVNDDAYVLAGEIGWEAYFPTYRQFIGFLERTPEIRWNKPAPNQRAIHAGDWKKYWTEHSESQAELLDARPEMLQAIANAHLRKQEREQQRKRATDRARKQVE